MNCPTCRGEINSGDVNLTAEVLVCHACQSLSPLPPLLSTLGTPHPPVEFGRPPAGAWAHHCGDRIIVGVSLNAPIAGPVIWFISFGSLACSVGFIIKAIALPSEPMFALFAAASIGLTCYLFWMALMMTTGRIELTIDADQGEVFKGVGTLGRRRRFPCAGVREIRGVTHTDGRSGRHFYELVIEGDVNLRIISKLMVDEERHKFLVLATRKVWAQSKAARRGENE